MKTLFIFALLVAATSSFISCSAQVSDLSSDGTASTEEHRIGGVPANEYFGQYSYKILGDCKKPELVSFRYFGDFNGMRPLTVGKDERGRTKLASLQLTLLTDGTYHGVYAESAIVSQGDHTGVTELEPLPSKTKTLNGTWSVAGSVMLVSGLGSGSGWSFNNKPLVRFKVTDGSVLPALVGLNVDMGAVISNQSDTGQSINQYCGITD